jgi:hypothetical protein
VKILLPVAAAAAFILAGQAAKATTYSITTEYCDHITLTVEDGITYGESDTADCDTSALAGAGKGKKFSAAGDFGYPSTQAWNWSFVLGKGGQGVGSLFGYDGSSVAGPYDFAVTYTKTKAVHERHQNNGRPSIMSRFAK